MPYYEHDHPPPSYHDTYSNVPHGYIPQGHHHPYGSQIFGVGYDYNNQSYSSAYATPNDHQTSLISQNNFDTSKFAGIYSGYSQNNGYESSVLETENIKSELDTSSSDLNLNESYELSKSPMDDALSMEFSNGLDVHGETSQYLPEIQKECKGTNNDANATSK